MSSPPAPGGAFDRYVQRGGAVAVPASSGNTVFKSGHLFISSKGLGWKSWKKRWFILTRTSLVFFKSDPNTLPQRSGEVSATLGGIDLNNSGRVYFLCSVVVREDKKLLTVLFPDGRDGRAFTLKAETSEDLFEWKAALEEALAQAPNAALVMGHNGIFRNDTCDAYETTAPNWREKRPVKSLVVGRPILLALEDIDGSPSFLEKALRYLEKHGIRVEGILRQAADVEEVDRRLCEYEQGRTEFAPGEDAHIVGDCVKHVLRELPSSPVPASCCTALLEAFRLETKEARINAMHSAISETFPEPNRRLLQRILKMMYIVASHTMENRMTASAVAACMAPLLLRPLLAGECEMDEVFDVDGDDSVQLLAAANAANSAQGIVATLMEEYEIIFDDDHLVRSSLSPGSQIEDSGSEASTDDVNMDTKDNGFHDAENDVDQEMDDDNGAERILSGKLSESSGYAGSDLYDYKVHADDSDADCSVDDKGLEEETDLSKVPKIHSSENGSKNMEMPLSEKNPSNPTSGHETPLSMGEILSSLDPGITLPSISSEYSADRHSNKTNGSHSHVKRSNFWGRNSARKSQHSESVDSSGEEELAIQRLEIAKNDLQNRIAKEARGNAVLQASLERRKQALHERRLALEQDVSRLQEQLQAERDLRSALEVGLSMSSGQFSSPRAMDSKTRAELEEIALAEADVARLKQKVAELHLLLNQQRQQQYGPSLDANDRNFVQPGFDMNLAFCNQEKHRNEESSVDASQWRNIKQHVLPFGSSRPLTRKLSLDASSSDSRGMEASTSMSSENTSVVVNVPKLAEGVGYGRQPMVASSTLVELTTRLDFFKERRSQLMEQLHSLDLGHGSASQGFQYKPPSPWNSPR
ncbi:rho GTPase-activating protein 7 isoform X3 [Aegilops tauschii subsp. strangulata]|uniref:Rho GTPase-activating protein 7 n=1 Tax=Aegilops tauschii subsp. strangulata TaxID=200361 RepID=A0A453I2B2_AEGTS|nr:rho GTPase-activating protein 7 isoform X3 [Aegilops tauschii subsp. strangulata]XP_044375068.1 rho GTPase-activating protein 7-like isoform X3 [Triticum aestivum]